MRTLSIRVPTAESFRGRFLLARREASASALPMERTRPFRITSETTLVTLLLVEDQLGLRRILAAVLKA
jgi:hypothetical protein